MPWKSTNLIHSWLDSLFNNTSFVEATPHLSLHTDHPGNTGANEVTGGSYARQPVVSSFAAAASSAVSSDTQIQWTGMPATSIFYIGVWSALAAGTFYGYAPIDGSYAYGTGANTGDVITSYAHGLSNDDRVVLNASIGNDLPAGAAEDTIYHVVGSTTDTFQVSTTQGGGALAFTGDGEMVWHLVVEKTVNASDSVTIASGQITFAEET